MASQETLGSFADAIDDTASEPDWTSMATTASHQCSSCGAPVDPQLVRIYADNDGTMHACPQCVEAFAELQYAASGREHSLYQPEGMR